MFLSIFRKKNKEAKIYPSFSVRIFLAALDMIVATLLILPVIYVLSFYFTGLDFTIPSAEPQELLSMHKSRFISQVFQALVLIFTALFFWIKYQSTPAKMLFSIKILDEKTMQKASRFQYFVRVFVIAASVAPIYFIFFALIYEKFRLALLAAPFLLFGFEMTYIIFNRKKRALHDILSGTIVVYQKQRK